MDSDVELPPILVHRGTMRVIDGMHRLQAAKLRGQQTIKVRMFEGSIDEAFVAAVEANIAHGLPLSLSDREAAARRIVRAYPEWSDRAIASVSGISAKTVGAIRRATAAKSEQSATRVGLDGRVRPVNSAEGRRRAGELFCRHPNASVREVAREAGISAGTAWDVHARIKRGEDPVPPRQNVAQHRRTPVPQERRSRRRPESGRVRDCRDRATILRTLRRDPAVRFTESGRSLLRWLDAHAIGAEGWEEVSAEIPAHCRYVIADLARSLADEWLELAKRLREYAEVAGSAAAGDGESEPDDPDDPDSDPEPAAVGRPRSPVRAVEPDGDVGHDPPPSA